MMKFVEYRSYRSRDAVRGGIGICRVGPENHFAMVIESSSNSRNALLILSEDHVRITEADLDILIIPGAFMRPVVSRKTIIFGDVTTHLGAIRFVDGKSKLLAADGDWTKFVDIESGDTEGFHSHEAPIATEWELVRREEDGTTEVLLRHIVTVTTS